MPEWIDAMQFEVAERDPHRALEDGKLRLVVSVCELPAGRLGPGECGQPGPHARGCEILYCAVVFMAAAVLPHLGDRKVAHGTQPGIQFTHAWLRYREARRLPRSSQARSSLPARWTGVLSWRLRCGQGAVPFAGMPGWNGSTVSSGAPCSGLLQA
jgi:hypothetical protein